MISLTWTPSCCEEYLLWYLGRQSNCSIIIFNFIVIIWCWSAWSEHQAAVKNTSCGFLVILLIGLSFHCRRDLLKDNAELKTVWGTCVGEGRDGSGSGMAWVLHLFKTSGTECREVWCERVKRFLALGVRAAWDLLLNAGQLLCISCTSYVINLGSIISCHVMNMGISEMSNVTVGQRCTEKVLQ